VAAILYCAWPTSTLELGIDVGDLDRVIQIDAPGSVASFLQRFGRTGRRAGSLRNCLFLATDQESLIQAIAIVEQWKNGHVEPIQPPPLPLHILAQQIMALALQERGVGISSWQSWLLRLPGFASIPEDDRAAMLKHMLDAGYVQEDQGILWLGQEGEETFGYRNFMELFSVFTSPPEFAVYWGREHLGSVHETTFAAKDEGAIHLSLAGRAWRVEELNWTERTAFVSPEQDRGTSRWLGFGRPFSFLLCRKIREILTSECHYEHLSRRATEQQLNNARDEFCWLRSDAITVRWLKGQERTEIWTYAGQTANTALQSALSRNAGAVASADNFRLRIEMLAYGELVQQWFSEIPDLPSVPPTLGDLGSLLERLKFRQCLPDCLAERMLAVRMTPGPEAKSHSKRADCLRPNRGVRGQRCFIPSDSQQLQHPLSRILCTCPNVGDGGFSLPEEMRGPPSGTIFLRTGPVKLRDLFAAALPENWVVVSRNTMQGFCEVMEWRSGGHTRKVSVVFQPMTKTILPIFLLAAMLAQAQASPTPVKAGDLIPDVTLRTEEEKEVRLRKVVSERPTVLIFYRGGWCPFCTRHLQSLAGIEEDLNKIGAQLLAISMDQPAKLKATPDRDKLGYRLLSDSDAAAAKAFGVAFKVDGATVEKYKGYGINLEAASGRDHHILPYPAVFVAGTDGKVLFAHVNPDYKVRLEPEKVLEAARAVNP
jgi:peroxiredoxin